MADDRKSTVTFTLEREQLDFLKRYGEDVNRSQQIRLDLRLLETLLGWATKSVYRQFSPSEASLLFDVLNGFLIDSIAFVDAISWPLLLSAEVEDGCMLEHLDSKWGVEREAMVTRLANLSPLEALAVFDAAKRFWACEQGNLEEEVGKFCG